MNTIIIDWRGPYLYDDLFDIRDKEYGLYLATGKLPYQREALIQYCGITTRSFYTRLKEHHKVHKITQKQEFWLGNIVYPSNISKQDLEQAESLIIYFWQPELNERGRISVPKPITLMNKWFKKNGEPRYRQHTLLKDLDDLLSWDGELWRSGNLTVWHDE
ncbi:hypothetical protein [Photobacterium iliopiscarium]|uniref:hypothetical protein n=1 Tax=Photobacterium iliopiscarium TaxID=56192 RepID=UPI001E4E3A78|nr:hypothetical protein [Photobacterium iliopiscarium]MCD9486632.1 hypothetical protein [Photobacterium iliopiscarium]MCF2243205.1 hypothetical protein [Photobacterium iliopiscarium]